LFHRYLEADCSSHICAPKINYNKGKIQVVGTKAGRWAGKAGELARKVGWQGRWAGKAGGLARQVGWQGRWAGKEVGWWAGKQVGRWAGKAGGLARQVGWQGRWADKAGGLTRQVSWQGRWVGSIDVHALSANIFCSIRNTLAYWPDLKKKKCCEHDFLIGNIRLG
jgi:hypothetical protein